MITALFIYILATLLQGITFLLAFITIPANIELTIIMIFVKAMALNEIIPVSTMIICGGAILIFQVNMYVIKAIAGFFRPGSQDSL